MARGVERAVIGALLAWGVAAAAWAQNQRGITHPCDRACLTRVVDVYVAALVANDPSRLPLAPNAKLTLNDDVVPAGRLFWDQAASVQARIDITSAGLHVANLAHVSINDRRCSKRSLRK